jgi:hypothetical protein
LVHFSKLLCKLGFALQTDAKRALSEPGQREHLALDLENGRLRTKRKRLDGSGKSEAMITQLGRAHSRDRDGLAARLLCSVHRARLRLLLCDEWARRGAERPAPVCALSLTVVRRVFG